MELAVVGEDDRAGGGMGPEPGGLEVGKFEQRVGKLQLVEELHRVRMQGVAAEVTVEVAMTFEDGDVDAGAAEEMGEDHAAGPAPDDDAVGGRHPRTRACTPPAATEVSLKTAIRVSAGTISSIVAWAGRSNAATAQGAVTAAK